MKELVLYIVKQLVSNPEQVEVDSEEKDSEIIISIKANSDDLGKIIGRNGRVVNSIRTIIKSISKSGKKHIIKVI